jgi:hypothetical protein
VWAADESQLWKPSVKGALPSKSEALSIARSFLKRNELLPNLAIRSRWASRSLRARSSR